MPKRVTNPDDDQGEKKGDLAEGRATAGTASSWPRHPQHFKRDHFCSAKDLYEHPQFWSLGDEEVAVLANHYMSSLVVMGMVYSDTGVVTLLLALQLTFRRREHCSDRNPTRDQFGPILHESYHSTLTKWQKAFASTRGDGQRVHAMEKCNITRWKVK